jgi:hypothetical protein
MSATYALNAIAIPRFAAAFLSIAFPPTMARRMDIFVRIAKPSNATIATSPPLIGDPITRAASSVMIAPNRTSHSTAVNRGSRAAGFFPFPAARVHGARPRKGSGFFNACVIHIDESLYT